MELIEGIIIKTDEYREDSKIAVILTSEGAVSVLVRSALKYKSKNFTYAQEPTKIAFHYEPGKRNALAVLTAGTVITSYPGIRKNFSLSVIAASMIDLTVKTSEFANDNHHLYQMLDRLLTALETIPETLIGRCRICLLVFRLKLLFLLGLGPDMINCRVCGKKVDPRKGAFSVTGGGIVCSGCAGAYDFRTVYLPILKILYLIKLEKFDHRLIENIPEGTEASLEPIVNAYYDHFLAIHFKKPF